MGSVQSEVKCPSCGWDHCMQDYQYRSDEMFMSCARCGFNYTCYRKYDVEKTKRIWNAVKQAFGQGLFKESYILTGQKLSGWSKDRGNYTDEQFTDEDYKSHTEDWIKRVEEKEFNHFFLFDPEGKPEFTEQEIKPTGAMRYKGKDNPITSCGHYQDKEEFQKWVDENKDQFGEAKITFKDVDGSWKELNCLTGEILPFKEDPYAEETNGESN